MSERYEKRGATLRLESSARGRSVITLREGGFAVTSAGEFTCGPLSPGPEVELPASSAAESVAEIIERTARGLAVMERLSLVEGLARHRLVAGSSRRRWEDANARLFVSLVRQPCGRRAALSLGESSIRRIDLAPVASVCQALALPESLEPSHATSVTLEPWVVAGLVRAMANERVEMGRGLRIAQHPPEGALDGNGRKVRQRIVRQSSSPWRDAYRPSYRFAPIHAPLHVALLGADEAPAKLNFVAVALASNWVRRSDTFLARAWIIDRLAGTVSFAKIVVKPRAMTRTTVTVTGDLSWYPEGAGAWGRRLTLLRGAAQVQSA